MITTIIDADMFLYYFTRGEAVNEIVGGTLLRLPGNVK